MNDQYSHRLAQAQSSLADSSLDVLIITHIKNIQYLVGFTGTTGVLVIEPGLACLYVDARYTTQAKQQVKGADTQETIRDVFHGVMNTLSNRVLSRVGFESTYLSHFNYTRMVNALSNSEILPTTNIVEDQRAVKNAYELGAIKQAVAIADAAFEDFCTWIKPGLNEIEVAANLERFQRVQGGDRKPSETVVASGPRTAIVHAIASQRTIKSEEPVMIDIGIVIDGYTSDLTRTIHLGAPSDDFRKIYELVLNAQGTAIQELRPGMSGKEIDALARQVIEAEGKGEYFRHATGHSLGLEIHESPNFSLTEETIIKPGMVLTVEPGIYIPGEYGVRIEDVVHITDLGCDVLTGSQHELVTIG